jgi:CubicO group peptidase (beta-lactamase class C family)
VTADSASIDTTALRTLLDRAQREVDDGLLPSVQIAVALHGELVAFETFGDATNDSRYIVFSSTKAFVAGAMWSLMGDGLVDVSTRVVELIPEFGTLGKDVITIEQVMLHTSGFPAAPMPVMLGATSKGRCERFGEWHLNWAPGTAYEYHPTSAHWVLAEIIERVTGQDYRDVVEQRVTTPAGLPRVLGIAADASGAAESPPMVLVGDPATAAEMKAAFGVESLPVTEVTPEAVLRIGEPAERAVGVPGGGGFMRASDLALYYQALLRNPAEMWRPEVLADATGHVRNTFPDRLSGVPANRGLGVVLAGDDGRSNLRGMGRTVSPRAFGHNGAYGQIAWADPASGLSLGYCTNGIDVNETRHPRRTTAISSLAAVCAR